MTHIHVVKFGGTSVGNIDRIKATAQRLIALKKDHNHLVAVVSAMGDTTDHLVDMAKAITDTPLPREMDMLLSTGEQISMALLSMALNHQGQNTVSLTGSQCGIVTSSAHTDARIGSIKTDRLLKELNQGNMVIVAGFQGVSPRGDITTLGRGGSDTSAVALAAALKASTCDIYTDVDGVYSTDPRKVKSAKKIDYLAYDEMLEMAKLGAGVIHPRAVELARAHQIKLCVKNSFTYQEGTMITSQNDLERAYVRGITCQEDIIRVTVKDVPDKPGIAFHLFSTLSKNQIPVDMIIQNLNHQAKNDISFTIPKDFKNQTIQAIGQEFSLFSTDQMVFDDQVAKLSVIGTGIMGYSDTSSTFFGELSRLNVNIQMISTSETRISCIIDQASAQVALKALHDKFIE